MIEKENRREEHTYEQMRENMSDKSEERIK
jgi:predicted small metal-binding protein